VPKEAYYSGGIDVLYIVTTCNKLTRALKHWLLRTHATASGTCIVIDIVTYYVKRDLLQSRKRPITDF